MGVGGGTGGLKIYSFTTNSIVPNCPYFQALLLSSLNYDMSTNCISYNLNVALFQSRTKYTAMCSRCTSCVNAFIH